MKERAPEIETAVPARSNHKRSVKGPSCGILEGVLLGPNPNVNNLTISRDGQEGYKGVTNL